MPPMTRRRQGYTLTELAFVLLIAGVFIGGIWAAGEMVRADYESSRATQQVTKVVQNIREYYMNSQALPATVNNQDITATLDGLGLFPLEMRRNPSGGPGGGVDHPFNNALAGGSFHIAVPTNCPNLTKTTYTCFYIRMEGLEKGACIRLLQALPIDNADLGISGIGAGFGAFWDFAAGASSVPAVLMTASLAEKWCNKGTNTNEVDWEFRLRK